MRVLSSGHVPSGTLVTLGLVILGILVGAFSRRAQADAPTTGRIAVTVLDTATGVPVFDATVVVTGSSLAKPVTAKTDMLGGSYAVDVPPGSYGVLVAFGSARVEHASIVVVAGETTAVSDHLDVSSSVEVTTVHDRAIAPPVVAPQPTRRSENKVLPYTSEAILTNDWQVAWLLLDLGADGKVRSFRFLKKPAHGLDQVAKREAFRLSFAPARDAAGNAVPARVLWKLEWPSYWRKDELKDGITLRGVHSPGPPCRGEGPLRLDSAHPVYRDCSPPDYRLAQTADIIRAPAQADGEPTTTATVDVPVGPPVDETEAIRYACDHRDADACLELSLRDSVPARAREFEDKACEAGNAASCVEIGARLIDGRETVDRARAAALFDRACKTGDARGCELAAANDPATVGAVLNDIVCAQGDPRACYNRALSLVKTDPPRASRLYERACLAGVAISCSNLGLLVEKHDPQHALDLYQRSCDDGEAIGCTNLGHMLLDGVGVKKDLPRARDVLEKACAAGDDTGCHNLAIMVEWGLAGPRDARRAKALRAR